MAITALYRKSSNEVIKISTKGQSFSDRDSDVWGVLTDPVLPDGIQVRDISQDIAGPLRQLGFAKIAKPANNIIRNAIQSEIDTFSSAELNDDNQLDADQAKELIRTHPTFRKIFIAFVDIIKDEINILRTQHSLPTRTLSQLKTQLLSKISKDD